MGFGRESRRRRRRVKRERLKRVRIVRKLGLRGLLRCSVISVKR
jgi:hypothetical protein